MQINQSDIYGILGNNIQYSLSPLIYNTLFRKYKINANYRLFDIPPTEIKTFIHSVKLLDIKGFNITIPCKELVVKYLNKFDPLVAKTKSVNMVLNQNGKLQGFNTDLAGIKTTIEQGMSFSVKGKNIALLGSGGAARSCYYYCIQKKAKLISVYHHSSKRTKEFKKIVAGINGSNSYQSLNYNNKIQLAEIYDLSLNCTPLPIEKLVQKNSFNNMGKIFELRYGIFANRSKTHFNGNMMLAVQAAKNFKLMTGIEVDYKVILRIINKALTG